MTMTTEIARTNGSGPPSNTLTPADFSQRAAEAIDDVIGKGDLTKMSPAERVNYYRRVCESLGLNPLTKPFEYVQLSGQLRFYATKGCTDQLRELKSVTVEIVSKEFNPELGTYEVWAKASRPTGRTDEDMGVVSVQGLRGEAMANAIMKAITKAKRRVTLSICGLGWLDETEIDSIPDARTVQVDFETGDILPEARVTRDGTPRSERTPAEQRAPAQQRPPAPNNSSAPDSGGTQNSGTMPACVNCGKALTKAQQDLSVRNYGEALCPGCQRDKQQNGSKQQIGGKPAAPAGQPAPDPDVAPKPGTLSPRDEVIQILNGFPLDQRIACFDRFVHAYGTKNINQFGGVQIGEVLHYLKAGEWPYEAAFLADAEKRKLEEEGDPFADDTLDQPELLTVASAEPVLAGKGHGES